MYHQIGYFSMSIIHKIRHYFATHFAASFSLVLALAIISVMGLMQTYLRRDYLQYFLDQSYEQEQAVMRSVRQTLNRTLYELMSEGSKMAVDEKLRTLAESLQEGDGSESGQARELELSNELKNHVYGSYAIASAVVGPDGLLAQYDRFKITNPGTMMLWRAEDNPVLTQMTEFLTEPFRPYSEREDPDPFFFPRIRIYVDSAVHPSFPNERVIHFVFPLTGGKHSVWSCPYALVTSYSIETFQEFLDTVNIPQGDYIQGYITDSDGIIIYHGDPSMIGTESAVMEEDETLRLISGPLDYFGLTLHIMIDVGKLRSYINRIYWKDSRIYFLLILFGGFFVFLVFRRLMQPVRDLSESMRQAENGKNPDPIPVRGHHELWQVADEYNHMLLALDEKNRELEFQHKMALLSLNQKHEAEQEALESQINAHFICNTLGCINYEAIEAGNHEVSLLIKKLSNILRYSFDQRHQEVLICQEIAWVDQYLYLQKMRREDVFDYEIHFPDVYGQWPCCKLMFQPFVENSILHGFEGRKTGGMIRISADMDGELLRIRIEDNGCGMDEATEAAIAQILLNKGLPQLATAREQLGEMESVENLYLGNGDDPRLGNGENPHPGNGDNPRLGNGGNPHLGIGIANVVTRMRMFYGDRFDVSMNTRKGEGTCFVFRVPIPDREMRSETGLEEAI